MLFDSGTHLFEGEHHSPGIMLGIGYKRFIFIVFCGLPRGITIAFQISFLTKTFCLQKGTGL